MGTTKTKANDRKQKKEKGGVTHIVADIVAAICQKKRKKKQVLVGARGETQGLGTTGDSLPRVATGPEPNSGGEGGQRKPRSPPWDRGRLWINRF